MGSTIVDLHGLVILFVSIFLCQEVFAWCWKLFKFGLFVDFSNETFQCKRSINYRTLKIASFMSACLAFTMQYHLISLVVHQPMIDTFAYTRSMFLLICGYLGIIHHLALMAKCTKFPVDYYPIFSQLIKRNIDIIRKEDMSGYEQEDKHGLDGGKVLSKLFLV